MATFRPSSCAVFLTTLAFLRCMSWSPWLKLNLVTSTPERTSEAMFSSEEVAGPRVATIFVRRAAILAVHPRVERRAARVDARLAEGLLDAQELVVLRHAVRAGGRAGLDLPGAHCNGKIRDRRVLGLPAAVAYHRRVPGLVRKLHRLEGLRQRADLVHLHQDGVAHALPDAPGQDLLVRDEEVVAHELDPAPEPLGEGCPALPVVLAEPVLDAQDRVLVAQVRVVVDHVAARELAPLAGQVVLAVLVELGGRRVEREADLVPQSVPAPPDGLRDERERGPVALKIWREPALVTDAA